MRYSARISCALTLSLAVLAVANSALDATTFARMPLEKLAASARVIVRARCVGNVVEMHGGEIWTVTSFEVREVWKGGTTAVIRTRLLGGRTRDLTSHVAGVPRFRPGEEDILFLALLRDGEYSVVGWAQGTFRVHRDSATRNLVVSQDTAAYSDTSVRFASSGSRVSNMPLEDFRRQIERALATGAAGFVNGGKHP